ncbi:hypothetical protein AFK68_05150, partial [Hydrocoleum sp. CS-953]
LPYYLNHKYSTRHDITLWNGVFENLNGTWLRWCDADGNVIKTGAELYHFEKRMLPIITTIKRFYSKCLFDKKDDYNIKNSLKFIHSDSCTGDSRLRSIP